MTVDDFVGAPVDIWPEHTHAVELFIRCGTQWRSSMSGLLGLDYNVLFSMMDRMHLTDEQWFDTLDDIRIMENEALTLMRKEAE